MALCHVHNTFYVYVYELIVIEWHCKIIDEVVLGPNCNKLIGLIELPVFSGPVIQHIAIHNVKAIA